MKWDLSILQLKQWSTEQDRDCVIQFDDSVIQHKEAGDQRIQRIHQDFLYSYAKYRMKMKKIFLWVF